MHKNIRKLLLDECIFVICLLSIIPSISLIGYPIWEIRIQNGIRCQNNTFRSLANLIKKGSKNDWDIGIDTVELELDLTRLDLVGLKLSTPPGGGLREKTYWLFVSSWGLDLYRRGQLENATNEFSEYLYKQGSAFYDALPNKRWFKVSSLDQQQQQSFMTFHDDIVPLQAKLRAAAERYSAVSWLCYPVAVILLLLQLYGWFFCLPRIFLYLLARYKSSMKKS